jgi:hypothetical protein
MSLKTRQKTVYALTAVIVVAMVGGYALAATSTLTITNNQGSGTGTAPPGPAPSGVSFSIGQVAILTENTDPALGTGSGPGNQLSGSQVAVASCATATCTDSYQPATSAGPAETVADYAQEFFITVTQGCSAATSGFDVQFAVNDASTTVYAQAFSNTGVSTQSGCTTPSTVTVAFFVDLGVSSIGNAAPVINHVEVVANTCVGTSTCP